ncbi:MAG: hypothetical protein IH987_11315 [Planctomycetes bacterium]|nr:hypothetical protein [Planctomycetota bacterium]
MLRIITFSLILLLPLAARGEDTATLISQASTAYEVKDYARSAMLYEVAIMAGASPRVPSYNAACCYALLEKADEAFTWLGQSLDAGWRDVAQLRNDTDFQSLHADPRWEAVVKRCEEVEAAFAKSPKEPVLRDELLERMKEDQRIRFEPDPNMSEWRKIDKDNTAYMKKVIDKHGWPGKSLVGADGAMAAFLLVQHASPDTAFQERCLPLLRKAVEQGEARAPDMALLTDRVLVHAGKSQRYGSQFHTVDGQLVPFPIEDEANVDALRKEVGLRPLAEYAKQLRAMQQQ